MRRDLLTKDATLLFLSDVFVYTFRTGRAADEVSIRAERSKSSVHLHSQEQIFSPR